jgi:hypothetical protein
MTPDRTPPISPGPAVTAIASTDRSAHTRLQRGLHRAVQALGMGAGGDLGDDAAILGMKVRLPDHDRRQDLRRLARSAQHRRGGVVATRFQSEDEEVLAQGWVRCVVRRVSGR